jgi:high-affinity nickel-transport protein
MLASTSTSFHVGLLVTAYWFGFRHGIDWDHIAALTDITGTQRSVRRSMVLATSYAVGHALVVFVLGLGAIVLADELPGGVDAAMSRIVGATLIVLGLYIVVSLVRNGRDFRMRSRWMLVFDGLRRLRSRRDDPVVIEHEHEHAPDEAHGHVHAHVGVGVGDGHGHDHGHAHRHAHRHVAPMPEDPFAGYSRPAAFGIGMLHGVGAETPTQVVIVIAAAGVGGTTAGVAMLVAFVVGLLSSNTLIALAGSLGFVSATKSWPVYAAFSVVTAVASLFVGTVFLMGHESLLPALFGG